MIRVDWNTIDWTHLLALRHIKMAYTFGAFIGVDLINELALVNGIIGAFWLANIAIYALIGDHESHVTPSVRTR